MKTPRIDHDRYLTPPDVAAACVAALPDDWFTGLVWEPHAGEGAFVDALKRRTIRVAQTDRESDFLQSRLPAHAIVGNPPYRDALAHVEHALSITPRVAFLLRLGFLASQRRRAFWEAHPPARVLVLSRRPSFAHGRTDHSDYAFFIWDEGVSVTQMGWI